MLYTSIFVETSMHLEHTEPVVISYKENIYTSFPDIVKLPNGNLFCLYREGDSHHPTESTIVFARSYDDGKTWDKENFRTVSLKKDGYVFNCPRISKVGNKYFIVSDTKSSQKEGTCEWNMIMWSSEDTDHWNNFNNLNIAGMVPDKIIPYRKSLLMAYHLIDKTPGSRHKLIQMMAISKDGGITWRDKLTVAESNKQDFCEGSLVSLKKDNHLFCYMRDNKVSVTRGYLTMSYDGGLNWITPAPLSCHAHRIVAGIKQNEPYAGAIIGTYRNTGRRSVEMFVQNPNTIKLQSMQIVSESKDYMYDFGYTGWMEFEDGSIGVVYYISDGADNPRVCFTRVKLLH